MTKITEAAKALTVAFETAYNGAETAAERKKIAEHTFDLLTPLIREVSYLRAKTIKEADPNG